MRIKVTYSLNPFTGVLFGFLNENPGVCGQGHSIAELEGVLRKNFRAYLILKHEVIEFEQEKPSFDFHYVEPPKSSFRFRLFQKLMMVFDVIFGYRIEVIVWNKDGQKVSQSRLL